MAGTSSFPGSLDCLLASSSSDILDLAIINLTSWHLGWRPTFPRGHPAAPYGCCRGPRKPQLEQAQQVRGWGWGPPSRVWSSSEITGRLKRFRGGWGNAGMQLSGFAGPPSSSGASETLCCITASQPKNVGRKQLWEIKNARFGGIRRRSRLRLAHDTLSHACAR